MNPTQRGLVLKRIIVLVICCVFALFNSVQAQQQKTKPAPEPQEKILNYESRIQVHTDASLTITETITVTAAGQQIKRGIFRTFPTVYEDRYGNTVKVGFEILKVLKNGEPEPYHTEPMENGVKIYIGEEDVYLDEGTYTYTLQYETNRHLGFFEEFDELYWNVTGNNWNFVIEKANAIIELPEGAEILDTAAYTGPQGAQGKNFSSSTEGEGDIVFRTTEPLDPGEGLTIAVSWPKGIVAEPGAADKLKYFLTDNLPFLMTLLGMLVLTGYYLFAWNKVGKDPQKGTIIPQYEPPEDFSPAAMRFITRMGYDKKTFATAVVDMAVKGYLRIEENDEDEFVLSRTDEADSSALTPEERELAGELLGSRESITLRQRNHRRIRSGNSSLQLYLKETFQKPYFRRNLTYLGVGIAITLAILGLVYLTSNDSNAGGILLMFVFWTAGISFLVPMALNSWGMLLTGHFKEFFTRGGVMTSLFPLPFFIADLVFLWILAQEFSFLTALGIIGLLALNALFYHLLKAPTEEGQKVMDKIEGFKMYLSVAEKERLNILNPPEKTPELFEAYLPYALALDVEHDWSEQFADVLARASQERDYSPRWYSGRRPWNTLGATGLAATVGTALTSTIASSSTSPGSSSGSGGGGSSGGGGGGGGGGGW